MVDRTAPLPQLSGRMFLTDAGLETDLIFHHGVEIREFAAHTLLPIPADREKMAEYFRGYLGHLRTTTRADIATYLKRYVIGRPHVGVALMSGAGKQTSGLTLDDLMGVAK